MHAPPRARAALALGLVIGGCGDGGDAPGTQDADLQQRKTRVTDTWSLGLREASGLAVRHTAAQGDEVLAVGDRDATLALAEAGEDAFELLALTGALPSGAVDPDADSQWEAVAADGLGRVHVLAESSATILVLDPKLESTLHRIELDVSSDDAIADDWEEDPNSRGEGLVLLRSGHLLVLKEKSPAAVIELGPEDDAPLGYQPGDAAVDDGFPLPSGKSSTFVALKTWPLSDKASAVARDASDLTVGPDGALFLVSDEGRLIARLEATLRASEEDVRLTDVWKLPGDVPKPEGLAFLPDGRAVVAVDSSSAKNNAVLLDPLD